MKKSTHKYMRITHRYLGFFLAGIILVYATSGIVLIFRKTDTFKKEVKIEKTVEKNIPTYDLERKLKIENLSIKEEIEGILYFENGSYNPKTGNFISIKKELPFFLDKMTKLHKATTKQPLYWLNIFFAISLIFFVISSLWMFKPNTSIFKKGICFSVAGIVLTLAMLFI